MTEPQPRPIPTQEAPPTTEPAVPGDAQGPAQIAPPAQDVPPAATLPPPEPGPTIKRTRTGGVWVALAFFAVILLLLLIFILQNSAKVSVSYMGAHGHLPLGVALLLAAVCGILLVVFAGTARILQLRTSARRHRKREVRRAKAAAKASS
jgi:uncharacterized integral membrane protein